MMLMTELYPLILLSPILLATAYCDLRWLRIPNLLVVAALLLFALTLPTLSLAEFGARVLVAALVFVVMYVGFCMRLIGGGDVKLLPVVMLYVPGTALTAFAYSFSAALGIGVMISLAMQNSPRMQRSGWAAATEAGALPVGVSIAIAGIALPLVTLALT